MKKKTTKIQSFLTKNAQVTTERIKHAAKQLHKQVPTKKRPFVKK